MAVSAIAQAPKTPNTLYFGTGEGVFNSDAIRGLGIWKTTDGGTTWNRLASTANSNFYYVNKIVVDTFGYVFAATRAGLFKSVDGGTNWTNITPPTLTTQDISDLEVTTTRTFYCGVRFSNNSRSLLRSGDGGTTWTNITPTPPASGWARTEIGVCESNPTRVYVMFQAGNSNAIGGIFRTDNAGTNWTTLNNPSWCDQGTTKSDFTRGQAWYDLIIGVDPTNSNNVLIGGVDILRSTDAGANFTQVSQWNTGCTSGFLGPQLPKVHADIHAIEFAPGLAGARVIFGTDGGVYLSNSGGTSFTAKNNGLNLTQYYSVAIHPNPTTSPSYFMGGTQDNGTIRTTAAGIGSGVTVTGGDGGFCYIDQTNSNIQISSFTNNDYTVTANAWSSSFNRSFAGRSFISPGAYDSRRDVLYASALPGTLLRWVSPSTNGPAAALTVTNFGSDSITHIALSANGRDTIYCGLSNGNVVRIVNASSLNGGTFLSKIIRTGSPGTTVSGIAIDPSNENHMLVCYSNYGFVSVYETFNAQTSGTPTWNAVEGDLPDMPIRWIMFDPRSTDMAWVATEMGVWSTDNLNNQLTDWEPTNFNLANTRVDMLQYRAADRTVVAATHGRGLFSCVVPTTLARINPVNNEPVLLLDDDNTRSSEPGNKVWATGGTILVNMAQNQPYQMEVFDQSGKLLRRANFNGSFRQDMSGLPRTIYYVKISGVRSREQFTTRIYLQ
jgi:photosystem II stability/assembly factor-like uncharacterized protein